MQSTTLKKRWLLNPPKKEHDDTLITRGMRTLNSLTISPYSKESALKMLTGNFINNTRHAYAEKATPDPNRKCSICGEPNSDYAKHYMLKCSLIEQVMKTFIATVQEITTTKCSWYQCSKWVFNSVKRYPSDTERLVFFQDLPPEIRGCGKILTKQIFSTLLCIQDTINNFRRRGVFRPEQKYFISQIKQKIIDQEHIADKSTIIGFADKLSTCDHILITYNQLDKLTNQFTIPFQDVLIQLRTKQIISTLIVHICESYTKHKNSIRERIPQPQLRRYDRLIERVIMKRTEVLEHKKTCKTDSNCGTCKVHRLSYGAFTEFLEQIKQENPAKSFNVFI